MGRWGVTAAVALLVLASSPQAGSWSDADRSAAGLANAVGAGRLSEFEAAEYGRDLEAARGALAVLGPTRGAPLAAVLRDVAAQAHGFDAPRALTLFSIVRMNTRHLLGGGLPASDVSDADGVVYRPFPGRGLRFHPLASFGALNAHARKGRYRRAIRLAYALLARARPQGSALVWESHFGWSGAPPPWTSGMTQSVAAQALARAGLHAEARLAYRALSQGLLLQLSAGPWVRIYNFSGAAVLNAQLQAALSVAEYARRTNDLGAARLAEGMRASAATLLPRFDTGFWSRYSLGGEEAQLKYHQYVASLLWKLSARTGDRSWARWAARFRAYWRKPPELRRRGAEVSIYPLPADGYRDRAEIRFWLSKPATVTLSVGGTARRLYLQPGVHVQEWTPGRRPPGRYVVRVSAVDRVGNRGVRRLHDVVVLRDREPPRLRVSLAGGRLRWRARDGGTPWLRLRVVLYRPGEQRTLDLRRRRLRGDLRVAAADGGWAAVLVAADSSGNTRLVSLAPS